MTVSHTPEKWNERYAGDDYFYGTEPNEFLVVQAHHVPKGGNVLCVADGEGRNGVWLAQHGYNVTSVDFSSVALQKTQNLASRMGVSIKTIEADIRQFEFENNPYDGIVAIYAHFPEDFRPELYARYRSSLKPGGCLILEGFSPEQLRYDSGGPKDLRLMYTFDEIKSVFADWNIHVLQQTTIHLDESDHHRGPAAVVRAVITKPNEK